MIQHTIPSLQAKNWQDELAKLISTPEALFEQLNLDNRYLAAAKAAHLLFPVRTTHAYAKRIKTGDINDPLLRQILPLDAELQEIEGYNSDPLEETRFNPQTGVVHKYQGRVLLVAANQCAINCRYCFRRSFDYSANKLDKQAWRDAITYITSDTSIHEVILSGGDPLVMSDHSLRWLLQALERISHVKRLRIHSRIPIVLPSRITQSLNKLLGQSRLKCVLVIHCNHAQEIDTEVHETLNALAAAGITLLNQSVLLHGVNDTVASLVELSERLFEAKTLPYYLHLLDKVNGAAHFNVDEEEAIKLCQTLRSQLPGYLMPRLARENPGNDAKTIIF